MLYSIQELAGYSIHATDGIIGEIEEVYFDEDSWFIRYLVVDVGTFLVRDPTLLIPGVITGIEPERNMVSVRLTKQEVKDSPDISDRHPLPRETEEELHQHYNWQPYWRTAAFHRTVLGTYPARPTITKPAPSEGEINDQALRDEPSSRLHNSDEVIGYGIEAADGPMGQVADLIVDDTDWSIRYLVIDTGNWLPGRQVLVSPEWVSAIRWSDEEVTIDLTRQEVENSPEYDPDTIIDREYETRLHQYYRKSGYWERQET